MKIKFIFLIVLGLTYCKTREQKSKVVIQDKKTPPPTQSTKVSAKSSIDSLDIKIGQMVMVGILDRTSILESDSLVKEITENKIGGIVLYEKNIAKTNSKETLKKLISDIQAKSALPLFISIDEEGGKVHRLKEKYGFVKMPSAAYLGSLNNTDSTVYYTEKLAALMNELGINLNYAPDVDLALNANNPVIAKIGRSYSSNPEVVTKHALASIRAHHNYGVKTIIKHFPGHGSSSEDSHLGIADVTNKWKIIELLPYKDIIKSGNCDAVMTAHIISCHLDTTCLPATLSKVIITDLLRNILEYKGVVFSDDMQMYAISKNYGFENAVKLSILAGVDVLMFANNVNQTDVRTASEIHAIIKKLVLSGEISRERIDESYRRIIEFKTKKIK